MTPPEITNEELNSLSTAILVRYGVDFTGYEPQSFKRRVGRAIAIFKLASIYELWAKLLRDRDFIYPLIDEITVGLTAMFRDPILWTTLQKSVLRQLRQENDLIQVWHAGCSTGEEVYTMGIVLREMHLQDKTQALATDINRTAIEHAKGGKYGSMQVAEYAANYQEYNPFQKFETYYTWQQEVAQFDHTLLNHVRFQYHNLVTEAVPGQYDIIFCRNVMIYFDTKAKIRLLEQFHANLRKGGFLVIGFYDVLVPLIDNRLFKYYDLHAKIFQKI